MIKSDDHEIIDDVTENDGVRENQSSTYILHNLESPEVNRRANTEMDRFNHENKEKRDDSATTLTSASVYDCKRGRQFSVWFRMMCRKVDSTPG
jgi:hypothetical protein